MQIVCLYRQWYAKQLITSVGIISEWQNQTSEKNPSPLGVSDSLQRNKNAPFNVNPQTSTFRQHEQKPSKKYMHIRQQGPDENKLVYLECIYITIICRLFYRKIWILLQHTDNRLPLIWHHKDFWIHPTNMPPVTSKKHSA